MNAPSDNELMQQSLQLTDDEVAALNAVDKVALIQNAVAAAVKPYIEMAKGAGLNPQEQCLVDCFRTWRKSPKSATGVFHYKIEPYLDAGIHNLDLDPGVHDLEDGDETPSGA